MPTPNTPTTLPELRARQRAARTEARAILDPAIAANRDLTVEETRQVETLRDEIRDLDERIDAEIGADAGEPNAGLYAQPDSALLAAHRRRTVGTDSPVVVRSEPRTYDEHAETSYFRDLISRRVHGDSAAAERLARHADEVRVELASNRELRALDRDPASGGEFVPPLWLMEQYVGAARAGRVTADRFTPLDLPGGTDTVNVPRIVTGAGVAEQTADNTAVAEVDPTTDSVSAPVRILAGQVDVSLQALEQSPVAFDQVIFQDLAADYASSLDVQVLNGSGAAGQLLGMLQVSGITSVTYTDADPTVPELYPRLASALNAITTGRHLPADAWVMHPRRWLWMLAALDSSSRPFIVPAAQGPQNAPAIAGPMDPTTSVGMLLGLPVFIDANVPTNLGAGTNEDRIIAARFEDLFLMESRLRTRVLPEVGSGTLTVRLQMYRYVASMPDRYPASIAVVTGTGLADPGL